MLPSGTILPFSVCAFQPDVDIFGRYMTTGIFASGHLQVKRCQNGFIYLLYCSLALLCIIYLPSAKSSKYYYFI